MTNDQDMGHDSGPVSKNGLLHCKLGQETVHDVVARSTELFNLLKTTNASLQETAETVAKRQKVRDIILSIHQKLDNLDIHYKSVNEICSALAYVQVKSLIPFKDDLDNIEQIQKHRRNLCSEPYPDVVKEREDLKRRIAERDEQLKHITKDVRDYIYEINTMLHVSKC